MYFNKKFLSYFLVIFTTLFIVVFAVAYVVKYYSEDHELDIILKNEKNNLLLVKNNLSIGFENIISDLEVLANSAYLKQFLLTNSKDDLNLLENEYLLFSKAKKNYDQIRFINLDGKEVVRINRNNGNETIVEEKYLQDKSGRYYFEDAIKLNPGEIFVSPLDLNIENGKIEQPIKPMIRLAKIVQDEKLKKNGLVVINFLAETLLNEIKSNSGDSLFNLMLVNSEGYFLKSNNKNEEWGFMISSLYNSTFQNKYPNNWRKILLSKNGLIENEFGIFSYETIYPISEAWNSSTGAREANAASEYEINGRDYFWKLISFVPQETINHYLKINGFHTFFSPIVFANLSLVIAFLGALLIVKRKNAELGKRSAIDSLIESEEKFKNLLDYTNGWEYWINRDGEIEYCSKAAEDITGYLPKEFISDKQLLSEIVFEEDREVFNNHYKKNINKETAHTSEFRILTKDGQIKYIDHKCQPIFNRKGEFIGRRSSNRDITENKVHEELLLESEKVLREELNNKDKFFSIISHDLKSPLYGLVTLSQMLRDERKEFSEKDLDESLDGMHEALQSMSNLVEELLEWSRLQTDRIIFEPEYIELRDLVDRIVGLSAINIKEKKLNISVLIDFRTQIFADKNMVQTILRNLITNAIKFTKSNGDIVISSVTRGDMEEITVADSGVGIEKEHLDKLFRIDISHTTLGTKKERGTGVGLVLCKELVEKHNGKIWVESKRNVGSQFSFTLPLNSRVNVKKPSITDIGKNKSLNRDIKIR